MTVRVNDLMAAGVVVARPDHTVDYVRRQMRTLEINAVPVADPDGQPVGIVRSADLIGDVDPKARVDTLMNRNIHTVDQAVHVREAARLMIKERVHHLIVTKAGKISGILSSFDFLELIASHQFDMKSDEPDFKTGIYQVPFDVRDT
jgi:predicted transcriptional regulator